MSKEFLRSKQYRKVDPIEEEISLEVSPEQKDEIDSLYKSTLNTFRQGNILKGKVLQVGPNGVLVDINYKSDGTIPSYEFTEHE